MQLNIKAAYSKDHLLIIRILGGKQDVAETAIRAGSVELKEMYGRLRDLAVDNDLLVRKVGDRRQLYVPTKSRPALLEAAHAVAHQSSEKMLATLQERYWWPTIRRDIKQYVSTCTECLRTRTIIKTPHA